MRQKPFMILVIKSIDNRTGEQMLDLWSDNSNGLYQAFEINLKNAQMYAQHHLGQYLDVPYRVEYTGPHVEKNDLIICYYIDTKE